MALWCGRVDCMCGEHIRLQQANRCKPASGHPTRTAIKGRTFDSTAASAAHRDHRNKGLAAGVPRSPTSGHFRVDRLYSLARNFGGCGVWSTTGHAPRRQSRRGRRFHGRRDRGANGYTCQPKAKLDTPPRPRTRGASPRTERTLQRLEASPRGARRRTSECR